jgi:hypothetical protein
MMRGAGVEFYNIDFSLQHQLRLAGASVPKSIAEQQTPKDPVARKKRLLRSRHREDEESAKVLKGMKDVAKGKGKSKEEQEAEEGAASSIKAKRWDEALEKPPLDYSEFFDEDVGQFPGITVWEIENFYPNQMEDTESYGKLYEGDCYIILSTVLDDAGALDWKIFFWIGEKATLDKRTCSAIHSVNLRNYLGARGRTLREEQADESEEFLGLFNGPVTYVEGARTASGFYTVEAIEYTTRTYRVHEREVNGIHLQPVSTEVSSLDPRYVFLVDAGLAIYVWYGKNCKNVLKSKARLMAEKISKQERKNKSSIQIFLQGDEPIEFWHVLADDSADENNDVIPEKPPMEHVPANYSPVIPRLYIVGLGMGYLELPQVEVPGGKLKQDLLGTKNVYILDCHADLFVWVGKKSTRLVRAAALKLSSELFAMLIRPEFAMINRVSEGTESQIFKSKFFGECHIHFSSK